MKLAFLLASVFFSFAPSRADNGGCLHDSETFRCVQVLGNYDGDTITVNIPGVHPMLGQKVGVRVEGIDTPEIKTKNVCEKTAGRTAQKLVSNILKNAKRVDLEHVQRDKYFRILANVVVDGKSLKEILLKNRLAYRYDGGTKVKMDWCNFNQRIPSSDTTTR